MDVTLAAILLSGKWRSDVALVDGALATVYLVGWYRLRCRDPRGSGRVALGALPRRACGAVSCAALSDRHARVAPLRRPHDPARVAHDGGTSNHPLGAPVSPPLEGCGTASPERPDPAPQGAPQGPAEPHVAEGASAFEPDAPQAHRHRWIGLGGREQVGLLAVAGDGAGQRAGLGAPSRVQLPELRDGLLHHLAAHALPSGPAASSGGPCRPSAASYGAGTLSSVCAWPRAQVNELGRHYTRRSGPRCAAARTYTPARPATRGRAARTAEVGLGPAAWSPTLFEPCPQHPPRRLAPS